MRTLRRLAFVDDLLTRHSAMRLRDFLLRRHYREDWEFDETDLGRSSSDPGDGPATRAAFYTALDQDLDTPAALRVLDRAARSSEPEARALLEEGRRLLGLDL